jgi:Undecaprenyl-phosphate glucose phosphotransferase
LTAAFEKGGKMGNGARSTAASVAMAGLPESLAPAPGLRRTPVSAAIVTRLVALSDAVMLLALASAWLFLGPLEKALDWRIAVLAIGLGALLGLNLLHLAGAYRLERLGSARRSLGTAMAGWTLTAAVLVTAVTLGGVPVRTVWREAAIWYPAGLMVLAASRLLLGVQIGRWRRNGKLGGPVAILGTGSIARRLLMHLKAHPMADIRIAGIYDDQIESSAAITSCLGHRIAGDLDDLIADIRRLDITTVIVAVPLSADLRLATALNKLSLVPVDVRVAPDVFGLQLGRFDVTHAGGITLLNAMDRPLRDWRWIAKEIEDRVLAAMILTLISPLLLFIALLIKLDSPGPVLFRQKRYGLNNRLIEVLKFRTMYHEARDDNAEQLTRRNDPRVTRVGAFLRRTSMDELPQFLNVLRGEMSIVGPRPHALAAKAGRLLYQDAVRYYDSRHRMKPGITGWAQVNGWRGETDTVEQIRKRVEHDLYYIENWSIRLDLKIIIRTVLGGFTGRHAY